mmetsp:Transcript_46946/g.98499  ORF Transcript_46946/g.98499 Transcript_46946/m.98499 type:complete len:124 (-) Transcript_46946:39-410(-)
MQASVGGDLRVIQRTPTLRQLERVGRPPGLTILVLSSFSTLPPIMMGLMNTFQNARTEASAVRKACANALMGTLVTIAAFRAFLRKRTPKNENYSLSITLHEEKRCPKWTTNLSITESAGVTT